jgi:putative DNA primase/helicase
MNDDHEGQPANGVSPSIDFLLRLRPNGPIEITSIIPDGVTTTRTFAAAEADAADEFIRRENAAGKNIYYALNRARATAKRDSKKKKQDIEYVDCLHVDADPKEGENPETFKARVIPLFEAHDPPPTAIVDSGNGIQGLWKISNPVSVTDKTQIADIESRNAALAEAFGADPKTRNIDRILRVPGTTNHPNATKKRGGRIAREATLIRWNDAAYPIETFPPATTEEAGAKKSKTTGDGKLTKEMRTLLMTPGRGAYTSRSELMFLFLHKAIRAGITDDEIVAACLDDAYAGFGIYGHIEDNGGANYVLRQIKKAREGSPHDLVLDPYDPKPSARKLIGQNFVKDGSRILHRHRGAFWHWNGSYYQLINDEEITSQIWSLLETAKRIKDGAVAPFKPTRTNVGEVFEALKAEARLDRNIEPPAWLISTDRPPASELFACGNGLLHLPTGKLLPPSSAFLNLTASDVIFDPSAPRPRKWRKFLIELFGRDHGSIRLLQDQFGYLLSPDTSQQKILMIIGPRRSGKGTIARILTRLLGGASVAGPTISSLSEQFGLEAMITKTLAIISDARIGARTDKSTVIERLLSISGEDMITVHRKFREALHIRLPTRLAFISNELPNLPEGSGAFAGRLLVLVLKNSFFGNENPKLTRELSEEMSGILNWSLVGYRRLQNRGYFIQPRKSEETIKEIEKLAAPVKVFIEECCEVGVGFETKVDELWTAYTAWCSAGERKSGSKEWFGRNLKAAIPGLEVKRGHPEKDRTGKEFRAPIYSGIKVNF